MCTCHFTPASRDAPALARVFFWPKKKGLRLFLQRIWFWKKWSKVVIFEGEFLFFWKWPYLDHKFLHVASTYIYINT